MNDVEEWTNFLSYVKQETHAAARVIALGVEIQEHTKGDRSSCESKAKFILHGFSSL